ncbi:MAG: YbdD/YjiX family protein [Methylococcaceae bacterium]|jgi:uncharacterized short protein YbdD (DUF466 family)
MPLLLEKILSKTKYAWAILRQLSGDDAYERYVNHHSLCHSDEPLLSRSAFFKGWQEKKWHGIKRCC